MRVKPRVVHLVSSLKRGGAETLLARLLPCLKAFDHSVLYVHDGPMRKRLESSGIRCRPVRGLILPWGPVAAVRLAQALREEDPDLIHGALWLASTYARLYRRFGGRAPVVTAIHQDMLYDGILRRSITRLIGMPEHRVIAVSEGVAVSIRDRFPGVVGKLVVIPNGIDAGGVEQEASARAVSRAALGIEPDDFVVGSVGRFVPVKNQAALIATVGRLAARHPRLKLLLVGAGPLEHSLRSQARDLGIADRVLWVVDQPALLYLGLVNLFAQPSDTEGLSIALLEALSCGVPAVVAATGAHRGHPVITHERSGLVVDPSSPREWDEFVERLLLRTDLREQYGRAGHELVREKFRIADTAAAYERVFRDALGLHSRK